MSPKFKVGQIVCEIEKPHKKYKVLKIDPTFNSYLMEKLQKDELVIVWKIGPYADFNIGENTAKEFLKLVNAQLEFDFNA